MKWTFEFLSDWQILLILIRGEFKSKEVEALAAASLQEGTRRNCLRYLADFSAVTVERLPSILDQYDRPYLFSRLGLPHSAKVAALMPPEYKEQEFAETVNRNRGYALKFFDSQASAIQWLVGGT